MKNIYIIILFNLLHLTAICQDATSVYNKCVGSTVTIETDQAIGSGFFIAENLIATNYHVISGSNNAYCYISNSQTKYIIEGYVAADELSDLIILKVKGITRTPLKLASSITNTGQNIYVIGSPKGLPATISNGIVSGLRDFNGNKLIQITAPISSGSSGGPVLNNDGNVIGVSVGQFTEGQNLNFAIPKANLELLITYKKNEIIPLSELPLLDNDVNSSSTSSQHENANLTIFYPQKETYIYNIDQEITIHKFSPSTSWNLFFNFNEFKEVGFIGIQTNRDNPTKCELNFTIFNATDAQIGHPEAYIQDIEGDKIGKSCRLSVSVTQNQTFHLRIWQLEKDNSGTYWGVWITDKNLNKSYFLGKIKTGEPSTLSNNIANYVVYFGERKKCNEVPKSLSSFNPLKINCNDPTNSFQFLLKANNYHFDDCVNGTCDFKSNSCRISFGGD